VLKITKDFLFILWEDERCKGPVVQHVNVPVLVWLMNLCRRSLELQHCPLVIVDNEDVRDPLKGCRVPDSQDTTGEKLFANILHDTSFETGLELSHCSLLSRK
jgi:hypothetical protein